MKSLFSRTVIFFLTFTLMLGIFKGGLYTSTLVKAQEKHDYKFNIWEVDLDKFQEDQSSKEMLLKDKTLKVGDLGFTVMGFYTDKDGKERFLAGDNESQGILKCEVIEGDKDVIEYNKGMSQLTPKKAGKVTLKFTSPNHEYLEPVIIPIEVKSKEEVKEPSKPFSIDVDVPSNIKSGQDVNVIATAKCSDKLENAKSALLIVGLYKSEGDVNKMINYSYVEKTMEPNKTVTLGAGFGIPENAKGYKVKVFVWDMWPNETQGGKALSEVKEFTVQ